MKNREISRQLQILNSLFDRTKEASADNLDLQSHWAKYLCVLVSGFLENAPKEIYSEYIKKVSAKPAADYAIHHLLCLQNPNAEKLLHIAGLFKQEWREELDNFLSDDGRKDAIDSVINNRHQIVHGKHIGLSFVRIKEYFKKCVDVMEFIETQCAP